MRTTSVAMMRRRAANGPWPLRAVAAAAAFLGPRAERSLSIALGQTGGYAYEGARMSRLETDWISSCIAADEEIKRDARRLRGRARELGRNNPLAKQFFRLETNCVIGPRGPLFDPRVKDNNGTLNTIINGKIADARSRWAERVSLDGRLSDVQLKRQLFRTMECDGEAFAHIWRGAYDINEVGLALEPVDADQVDEFLNVARTQNQNEIRMGIELDTRGRRIAYHVWNRPFSWAWDRERIRIPASDMLHMYDPDRINQTRGVTALHAATLALHFLGEYVMYELVAARLGAAKPIIWVRKDGAYTGEETSDPSGSEPRRPIEEIEPGMAGYAPEGYMPATINLDHPSLAFNPFLQSCGRDVTVALGWSYAELTEDFANINLSSQRASRRNLQNNIASKQEHWIGSYERPLHDVLMTELLLQGYATAGAKGLVFDQRDPRRFRDARWIGQGSDYMDPLKDAHADALEIAYGLNSRQRIIRGRGDDPREIFHELAEENDWADEDQISISNPTAVATGAAALSEDVVSTGDGAANGKAAARRGRRQTLAPDNRIVAALLSAKED